MTTTPTTPLPYRGYWIAKGAESSLRGPFDRRSSFRGEKLNATQKAVVWSVFKIKEDADLYCKQGSFEKLKEAKAFIDGTLLAKLGEG